MAKKREVADLSGNFRRVCPHSMRAKGFAGFCRVGKNRKHTGACSAHRKKLLSGAHVENKALRTPCTSIAKTVQKLGGTK